MKRRDFLRLSPLIFAPGLVNGAVTMPLPYYHIEIIAFEQLTLKSWTEEVWPEQPPLDNIDNLIQLKSPTSFNPAEEFQETLPSERSLNALWEKLQKSRGYHPLYWTSWKQPTQIQQKARGVFVQNITDNDSESLMTGQVRLYKNRFTHVALDINLERRIPTRIHRDFAQHQGILEENLGDYWTFNLHQERKITPGKLEYFDHPIFGLIIKVSEIKPEDIPNPPTTSAEAPTNLGAGG